MGPRSIRAFSLALCPVIVAAMPLRASAGEEQNKVLATDLFDKGIKKMEEGKCDQPKIGDAAVCREARDLFRRSYEVYPAGLGALRNLAYVELGLGLYASAARRFREIERKAPTDPNPKRHAWAELAKKELLDIEPRIPHLTIKPPVPTPPGLVIKLDDSVLPEAVWATSLDVDPGPHTVHAEATGLQPFDASFEMVQKQDKSIEVAFAAAPAPAAMDPAPARPSRVGPIVTIGVGTAIVIVGLGFGYSAISQRKEACGSSNLCEPSKLDDARSAARLSNIVTGVGLAAVAGGVLWLVLKPRGSSESHTGAVVLPWASASGGGLFASVRF